MSELFNQLSKMNTSELISKSEIVNGIKKYVDASGYTIIELRDQKPWGAYLRFDNKDANRFIKEFFPGFSMDDISLGGIASEFSPKILIVSPGKRLSWQWHSRRAEIWAFLHGGYYAKSLTDEEVELQSANDGDVVRMAAFERHRLVGDEHKYTLVAEIWSHTDANNISDEDDIVRIQDDYSRQA